MKRLYWFLVSPIAGLIMISGLACAPHGTIRAYHEGKKIDERAIYWAPGVRDGRMIAGQTDTFGRPIQTFPITSPSQIARPLKTAVYVGTGVSLVFEER